MKTQQPPCNFPADSCFHYSSAYVCVSIKGEQLLYIITFGQKITKQLSKLRHVTTQITEDGFKVQHNSPFFPSFSLLIFPFFPLRGLPSDYLTPEDRWSRDALGVLLLWEIPCVTKAWPGCLSCREGPLKHCSLCHCCASVSLHL